MNNTFTNKNFKSEKLDWNLVQIEIKNKLGSDIYESWLNNISFVVEFNNYILLSVPTRFIRDWITSRYLDQILQTIKNFKKENKYIYIHREYFFERFQFCQPLDNLALPPL